LTIDKPEPRRDNGVHHQRRAEPPTDTSEDPEKLPPAVATVVLSYLAALGVSGVVFRDLSGFAGADAPLPLFGFVFLVALGIHYNIFLMTRVREEIARRGHRTGTLTALAVTGGVATSAGLVLAGTFTALAVLPLVFLAQLAFLVAFGVLLEALVVRTSAGAGVHPRPGAGELVVGPAAPAAGSPAMMEMGLASERRPGPAGWVGGTRHPPGWCSEAHAVVNLAVVDARVHAVTVCGRGQTVPECPEQVILDQGFGAEAEFGQLCHRAVGRSLVPGLDDGLHRRLECALGISRGLGLGLGWRRHRERQGETGERDSGRRADAAQRRPPARPGLMGKHGSSNRSSSGGCRTTVGAATSTGTNNFRTAE
jgi:hypothetical protein